MNACQSPTMPNGWSEIPSVRHWAKIAIEHGEAIGGWTNARTNAAAPHRRMDGFAPRLRHASGRTPGLRLGLEFCGSGER